MSLVNMVMANPNHVIAKGDQGLSVTTLQQELATAGYRMVADGIFGDGTELVVKRFQAQMGLVADGRVGPKTAAALDAPHEEIVAKATPMVTNSWPHDDTASMQAFYGKPWENAALLGRVPVPWRMIYTDDDKKIYNIPSFPMHTKCVAAVTEALQTIWSGYGKDQKAIEQVGLHNFGGSYNYRPIRGSSRLSTHAFGAGLDLDPVNNPLIPVGQPNIYRMPKIAVDAFADVGAYWGDNYKGRKDPMHFQFANEG